MGDRVRWHGHVVQPQRRAGGGSSTRPEPGRGGDGGVRAARLRHGWRGLLKIGGGLTGEPPKCVGPSHSGRGAGDRWDPESGK
jgi:hypothetical protein